MLKDLKIISFILIIISLSFGIFILTFVTLQFTNYSGDQINDAYRVMGIWEGKWPTLGPGPAAWSGLVGDVYLPPLYYYLVFPATILTHDLLAQAIPNALFTFLTIPLLALTIYKLLEGVNQNKRFLLSALAGFWYILLFRNIVLSTGDSLGGNPVSIPFFLLAFTLLYTYQLEAKLPLYLEVLSWITYGLILAIITNLHFSSLFVIPVVFIISIVFYIFQAPKKLKRWILPSLSIITALLALTPYWLGELGRNWINTQRILSLVFDASTKEGHRVSLFQRFNSIINSYFDLGQAVYFMGNSWKISLISSVFLGIILVVGISKFRGNRIIFGFLWMTWIIFLLAYSSTDLKNTYNPVFYKILLYLAPLFLAICSLAYLNSSRLVEKCLTIFIVACITISIIINTKYFYNYISSRGGMPRVPNTSDISQALVKIPPQATVCHPKQRYQNIRNQEYIDRYVNQGSLKFVAKCEPSYYLLYPKYKLLGDSTFNKADPLSQVNDFFDENYQLFDETSLFYIYQIKPVPKTLN